MSLHYLLDGYNIIHQAPALTHGSLEARRNALLSWLINTQPQGSSRNQVTIVYDGRPEHFGHWTGGDIRILFSDGESADEYIKRLIEDAVDKKNFVVVSDDKGITLYVRAMGARIISVKEFANDLFSRRAVPGTKSDKNISNSQAHLINEEFKRLWLK